MLFFSRCSCWALVLLGSPLLVPAQSAAPAGGWQKSIGLHFTPTLNYRQLSGDNYGGTIADYRDDAEASRLGFDAGATLRLTRGEHLGLDAGLSFASRGYRVKARPIDPGFSGDIKTKYRYQFLSIPLQATYAFGTGRLQGFVGGGVSLDFLLGVQTVQTLGDDTSSSTERAGYLRGNLTPRLTAGLRYALTPRYRLELAPVAQYSLLASRIHGTVNEHLYSAGVNVGVYRNF